MTGPGPAPHRHAAVARVRQAYSRIAEVDRPEVWIDLLPIGVALAEAEAVDARVARGESLPLAGTTLAVKGNIDVAGLVTTAGCPAYGSLAREHAPAVRRLVDAGAVLLGTTNLDQFATGLVGTRSPHGAVRDAVRPEFVSGGSSSGSAVAVALGIADVALGTDTAGSGRVPAAFGGIVGLKPTRGLIPTAGVVPACRELDCVSVFARELPLAELAAAIATGPADGDPTARSWPPAAPLAAPPAPRVGVPGIDQLPQLTPSAATAFQAAATRLAAAGAVLVDVDLTPFLAAGRLLYDGAFVAQRHAAVGAFVEAHPDDVDPTVRAIVTAAGRVQAHRYVADTETLDGLRLQAAAVLADVDALLLPTTTRQPTIADVAADPIGANSALGVWTNCCNLLDLAAVAVPAGQADGGQFGVTVLGPAFSDRLVADVARLLTGDPAPHLPAGTVAAGGAPGGVPLVVLGAHLTGQPLNGMLTSAGSAFVATVRTAPVYRLFALDTVPAKPGLVRVASGGGAVEGELWLLPPVALASLLATLPVPMALGPVELADGSTPVGFLCEPAATAGCPDITEHGGWRAYLAASADGTAATHRPVTTPTGAGS